MQLLRADDTRRFAVVSAPGKRFSEDIKVTDLLYQAHEMASVTNKVRSEYDTFFDGKISSRYLEIASELGSADAGALEADLEAAKQKVHRTLLHTMSLLANAPFVGCTAAPQIYELAVAGQSADFAASRGEALNGQLFAGLLGWEFVDPAAVSAKRVLSPPGLNTPPPPPTRRGVSSDWQRSRRRAISSSSAPPVTRPRCRPRPCGSACWVLSGR
jgi:aspartate kinase